VIDALLDATVAAFPAEDQLKLKLNEAIQIATNTEHDKSAKGRGLKGSMPVARAQLLWRFESLRFNGGGTPVQDPLLGSSATVQAVEKDSVSHGRPNLASQAAALAIMEAEAALASDGKMETADKLLETLLPAVAAIVESPVVAKVAKIESPRFKRVSHATSMDFVEEVEGSHGRRPPPEVGARGVVTEKGGSSKLAETSKDSSSKLAETSKDSSSKLAEISKGSSSKLAETSKGSSSSSKCVVYTYVDDFLSAPGSESSPGLSSHPLNDSLALWRDLWAQAGWTPVVLGDEDAARHPKYSDFKAAFGALPFAGEDDKKRARLASFMRYVAVAQAVAEKEGSSGSSGGSSSNSGSSSGGSSKNGDSGDSSSDSGDSGGGGGGGGGAWLSEVHVLPVQLASLRCPGANTNAGARNAGVNAGPPRQGALTLYQEYNPSLVSGSADAFEGFASYAAFGLDWKADPTYPFHGQDVRFFGPPAMEQYLGSATLLDAKEVYPGFHVTEVSVHKHLLSLEAPSRPVDVAGLSGTCGTVVPAQQWAFSLDGLTNCTYGGASACKDVANRYKFLHAKAGARASKEGEESSELDSTSKSETSIASLASRGPLAASFSVRAVLDLRRKVLSSHGKNHPAAKARDASASSSSTQQVDQNATATQVFSVQLVEVLRGLEQAAPSSAKTAASWKEARGKVARMATQAHRASCGLPAL